MSGDMLVMSKSQMQELAAVFGQQSEAANTILAAVDRALNSTTWQGARANHFREQWNGPFKSNLVALQNALAENAAIIGRELQAGVSAMDTL
ncbi:MAG: hypothetical protein AAF081_04275 [Actinomycetota bacterium]